MAQKSGVFLFRRVPQPDVGAKKHSTTVGALLRFVRFEVGQHLGKTRWWVLIAVGIITSYILIGTMLNAASQRGLQANIWDGLFAMFSNQYLILYCLTPLYLYLVSDLASESWFSEAIVLRLQSRRRWWTGKVAALAILTSICLVMLVGVATALASFVLPWQNQWSQNTVQYPMEVYVPPAARVFLPGQAFSLLLLLLALGWFCLGLVILVSSRWLGSVKWGFAVGLLINISGILVLHGVVPESYSIAFINTHILFHAHAFGDAASSYPSFTTSLLYWLGWGILLFCVGWWFNGRHDFLRPE